MSTSHELGGGTAAPPNQTITPSDTRRGARRWAAQMTIGLAIYGAVLFLAAGRPDWTAGWAYLGLNALTQLISAGVLMSRHPDLLTERSQGQQGTKDWDRYLAPVVALVGPLAWMVTAGLDARFGWSPPIGRGLWLAALAAAFGCQMFVLWAMASNPFFANTVRIQKERGHAVTSHGPYRLVRHPGYLGALLFGLAAPLALTSLWAYLPALATNVLIVVRTGLEDRTLQAELPGYREYAAEVRYRLIPGVW